MVAALALLSGCMSNTQTATLSGDEDVAAILPTRDKTGSVPRDPYVSAVGSQGAQVAADSEPLVAGDGTATAAMTPANTQGSALGIMQTTGVKANSGSIFASVVTDPSDPNSGQSAGRSVKPMKASLFSMNPEVADPLPGITAPDVASPRVASKGNITEQAKIIVPPSTDVPENSPDYDAGIVVIHPQSDEERKVMADKNDLEKNAHPQIRAMEPDSRAAPANGPSSASKSKKKGVSLPDLFGGLGRNNK